MDGWTDRQTATLNPLKPTVAIRVQL